MSTEKDSNKIVKMRHTLAHVLAAAVSQLYKDVKFGIGPATEDGFYYDFDFGNHEIPEKDLKKIEQEMRKTINKKLPLRKSERGINEAIKWAKDSGQTYKEELLKDLKEKGTTEIDGEAAENVETVTFYTVDGFEDLCRGPHLDDTGEVGAFKLMRVSGAYWRGDEKNQMLQRIYGVAFETKEELDKYLEMLEEAKKRDHRKIGKEMDLFVNSELIGAGLPMFTPRGTVLRDILNDLVQGYRLRDGYQKVWTPNIAKLETYKVSGHFEKFPELLHFKSLESGDELALKPVSCPHHSQIFASLPRTYRELPVKYLETATVYRDERKGELGGLARVRAITQDDSHVFCTDEQVGDVFANLIEAAKDLYKLLDMKLSLRLSFRDDSDGYIGDDILWEKAQNSIKEMADRFGMEYEIGIGEAAMYGPKMDFMVEDALGREWQLATVQLDYALPGRFGLEYIDKNGEKKVPVMVHCALIGSIERFLAVYIEHTAGKFPVWCAPEQLRLILVKNDDPDLGKFTYDLHDKAKQAGIRMAVDDSNNSVGKKIRSAEIGKVPYVVVLGEKELESGMLSVRVRSDLGEGFEMSVDDLIARIRKESLKRSR